MHVYWSFCTLGASTSKRYEGRPRNESHAVITRISLTPTKKSIMVFGAAPLMTSSSCVALALVLALILALKLALRLKLMLRGNVGAAVGAAVGATVGTNVLSAVGP